MLLICLFFAFISFLTVSYTLPISLLLMLFSIYMHWSSIQFSLACIIFSLISLSIFSYYLVPSSSLWTSSIFFFHCKGQGCLLWPKVSFWVILSTSLAVSVIVVSNVELAWHFFFVWLSLVFLGWVLLGRAHPSPSLDYSINGFIKYVQTVKLCIIHFGPPENVSVTQSKQIQLTVTSTLIPQGRNVLNEQKKTGYDTVMSILVYQTPIATTSSIK